MSLSHTQYLTLLHTNDFFTRTGNRDNYSLVRRDILHEEAIQGASLAGHSRALWRYGIRCIIRNIRRLKCTYNRAYLHSMWTQGQQYLQLYADQLRGLALTDAQQTTLRDCENALPTLTVLVWRTLAEAQVMQVGASLPSHVAHLHPAATVVLLQLQRQSGGAAVAAVFGAGGTASGLCEDTRPRQHQRDQVSAGRRRDAEYGTRHGGRWSEGVRAGRENQIEQTLRRASSRTRPLLHLHEQYEDDAARPVRRVGSRSGHHERGGEGLHQYAPQTEVSSATQRGLLHKWDFSSLRTLGDSRLYLDKRDMIQLRLRYGNALYVYGNINNVDVFWNMPSILKIASFFDNPNKPLPQPPKHTTTVPTDVPQIFTVLTYLYTVHPSLTVDNLHLYVLSDASDADASMMVVSVPEIHLRGRRRLGRSR